jgi:hypothetical protein
MVTFQQAYEAAAARYAPEVWLDLRPDLRINAIYEEMRRLDSEVAAVMDDAHTTHGKNPADQEQLEHVITQDPERRSARNVKLQKIDRPRIARKRPGKQKPEALGRRLLAIVVYDKRCRIGGTLTLGELAETSVVGDWKMPDFRMACSYAVAQGWLIVEYDTMTLTMAGLSGLTIGVSHSGHSAEPHGRRPTLR